MTSEEGIVDLFAWQPEADPLFDYLFIDTTADTLTIAGANVLIQSGSGATDNAVNGLGNLILGYNENDSGGSRAGSHNLVVGAEHAYTRYGAIVAGYKSTSIAPYASVLGGAGNTAAAVMATVLGGDSNVASGVYATVGGGGSNVASGWGAEVAGGRENVASGRYSTVAGGGIGTASGDSAAILGGFVNTASGELSVVYAGGYHTAGAQFDYKP